MVLNPDKYYFMVLGDPNYTCNLRCNGTTIKCSKTENFLGVTTDDKLTLTRHLVKRCMRFEQNKLIVSFL